MKSNWPAIVIALIVAFVLGFYVGVDYERRAHDKHAPAAPYSPAVDDREERPLPSRPRSPFRVNDRCVIVRSGGAAGSYEVDQSFGTCRVYEITEGDFIRVRDERNALRWVHRALVRRIPEPTGMSPPSGIAPPAGQAPAGSAPPSAGG